MLEYKSRRGETRWVVLDKVQEIISKDPLYGHGQIGVIKLVGGDTIETSEEPEKLVLRFQTENMNREVAVRRCNMLEGDIGQRMEDVQRSEWLPDDGFDFGNAL